MIDITIILFLVICEHMYMRIIHTGLQLNIRQAHISVMTTEQVNEQKTLKHGTNKRR